MKPDKIHLSLILLIILTTFSWITSCTHKSRISDFPEICFKRDVLPVFQNNCAIPRCHDGGGRESERALNTYADISRYIVPGNPNASSAYQTIISKWGGNNMPPGQPLSLENRTIIRLWIEQGAGETTCPATAANGKSIISGAKSGFSFNY